MVSLVGLLLIAMVVLLLVVGVAAVVIALIKGGGRQVDQEPNPNLAPCPGCQTLISIQVAACPRCGHQLNP